MKRHDFFATVALAVGALFSPVLMSGAPAGPEKLNVLFIVADDLNNDLGCYGHSIVKSPNIDRLGARAVRFDRAYCQYPVCNPSRTSFLSGQRPDSTGVVDNVTPPRAVLKDTVMLPEYFRRNGYRTFKVGKIFHTGNDFEDPRSWDTDIRETAQAKNPPPTQILHETGARGIMLKANDQDTWDGLVARKAVELMEKAAGAGQPFFVAAGFRRPHAPYIAPEKYFALYDPVQLKPRPGPIEHLAAIPRLALTYQIGEAAFPKEKEAGETMAAYYASISFMDAQVGVLLDALDRLKLWDRTVVVFFGDHGYHLGEHGGLWHKMTLFEESARVPLLVAAPGKKSGVVSPRLVELVDLYPTLADLCGLKRPSGLEGTSFVPLLESPSRDWKKAAFTVAARGRLEGGQQGALGSRKLDPNELGRSVRTERFRYTEWPDGNVELYDHDADPHEYVNLAKEPSHAKESKELKKLLRVGWRGVKPPANIQ